MRWAKLLLLVGFGFVLLRCRHLSEVDDSSPAGTTWTTTFTAWPRTNTTLDILLVVDNSPSMKDKQPLLGEALPDLVRRIVWPDCVDSEGYRLPNPGVCPPETHAELRPIHDVHIGIISTSLGGHGSGACPRDLPGKDDRGRLIPSVRSDAPDPDNTGFLSWRGGSVEDAERFLDQLRSQVEAVGSDGCEYPAPLEAWYRFLVDPTPALEIMLDENGHSLAREEDGHVLVDQVLLDQRAAFLRHNGPLHIIMVSDQDDCSLMVGGDQYENSELGHLLLDDTWEPPRASLACSLNPNHECCFSCLTGVPPGCSASECDAPVAIPPHDDRMSLRCFDTKRRFGLDLHYPIERYVEAITQASIVHARSSQVFDNPIFRDSEASARSREPSQVMLTGLVGVPWQDVATDASIWDPDKMEQRSSYEVWNDTIDFASNSVTRGDLLVGNPPLDPFLTPSIAPRTSGLAHPLSGDIMVRAESTDPLANQINGHEAHHDGPVPARYPDGSPANDALQASCIFPLEEPVVCQASDPNCLCSDEPARNRAACQPPAGGPSGLTQYFAEARPAPRILQVLRDVGLNSFVGSLCPKFSLPSDASADGYGFNPVGRHLMDSTLTDGSPGNLACTGRSLSSDESGQVSCVAVEVWPEELLPQLSEEEACAEPGRAPADDASRARTVKQLRESGFCDGNARRRCSEYGMCEISQLKGDPREQCATVEGKEDELEAGYCHIDEQESEPGQNLILRDCRINGSAALRFTGPDTPRAGSIVFIACETKTSFSPPG